FSGATPDGCGGGTLPEGAGEDDSSGTTQPGYGEGFALPELPEVDTLGPLILVGPEHDRNDHVVVVVRSPTYGLTQPTPGSFQFAELWASESTAEQRIETLFAAAQEQAVRLENLCGRPDCR
ncbi:MAG: hypothetical protein ACRBN8_24870, partial [Nannocystales bacterium]